MPKIEAYFRIRNFSVAIQLQFSVVPAKRTAPITLGESVRDQSNSCIENRTEGLKDWGTEGLVQERLLQAPKAQCSRGSGGMPPKKMFRSESRN